MSFTAWKKHTAIELYYVTLIFLLEFLECYLTLKVIFFVLPIIWLNKKSFFHLNMLEVLTKYCCLNWFFGNLFSKQLHLTIPEMKKAISLGESQFLNFSKPLCFLFNSPAKKSPVQVVNDFPDIISIQLFCTRISLPNSCRMGPIEFWMTINKVNFPVDSFQKYLELYS